MTSEKSEKKGRYRSERPPVELKKERDAFLQTFFRKGAQLTSEVLDENRRLRTKLAELEADNARLRAHVKSDDAIRELLKKIEGLEAEKGQLFSRFLEAEEANSRAVDQYAEIEGELANLANLYVASAQLHSSLDVRTTLQRIKELLNQLVGAKSFAIYLSDDNGAIQAVASEGVKLADLSIVAAEESVFAEVLMTGVARIEKGELPSASSEQPLAVVPLTIAGKVFGLIVVFSTLEHKPRFLPVDFELFNLLGARAGQALVLAKLFTDTERTLPDMSGLLQGLAPHLA